MRVATESKTIQNKTSDHRAYLALSIPLIISGMSTPILGAVDTAVVGRIPDTAAIGGVAIGAVIFNTIYWLLGFLRVSTSGFTAQAEGANNQNEMLLSLLRPTILAILFGALFIIFQQPILQIALTLIGGSEAVSTNAATYFSIRIWGAPFLLLSYVIIGWLIGMGKVRLALFIQIGMNVINILLDFLFVFGLGLGVAGVGYASLIAEASTILFGCIFIYRTNAKKIRKITRKMILQKEPLLQMLKVNRDLFLRTVCLLVMTGLFTSSGASMGEVTLAANAILLQIHYMMAYLFGGFANASSILVGRAVGTRNHFLFKRAFSLSLQWGLLSSVLLFVLTYFFGDYIVVLFTNIPEIKAMTTELLIWMLIFPFVGFLGLLLEGIFSGATEVKPVRDSIFLALLFYVIALWILIPIYQNNGLWMAFLLFSLGRSIFLLRYVPKLTRTKFS